jgi:streptomycin 6-kinase
VSELEMPRSLVRALEEDADVRAVRARWMAALPSIVDELASRWSLDLGRPFQPGGSTSWVAPARNLAGERLVLKVGLPHYEALHEADGLRAWDGRGAARLHDALVIDETSALLLELCEPGAALSQLVAAPEQDAVIASLLRGLWIEPPAGHRFRPLQSMCDAWADAFEEKQATFVGRGGEFDPGLMRAGVELLRGLPATAERSVLLCTDLHPQNVLAAQREPWLMIDPKPYVGDPTYDPVQHMLNLPIRLKTNATGFVERMAGLLDLNVDRLGQWLVARCVQESIDQPHLRSVAISLAP